MALRGSSTRRSLGSPMIGLLRDLDRRTRTTARRKRPTTAAQPDKQAEPDPVTAPTAPTAAAAVIETDEEGRARWTFPARFHRAPVLSALPVDPAPDDVTSSVVATLETATEAEAVLRVLATRPLPSVGWAVEPVGSGIRVHLTATPTDG
ncbi:hypothetical protein [Streptomyces sp. BH104]|uniref:hypothetical protein n=1 Tax=Streptomyces sp. BH104 TaxID=3410407 RepID=UPI003BB7ADB3